MSGPVVAGAEALRAILHAEARVADELRAIVVALREAVRRADVAALGVSCAEEQAKLHELRGLERRRVQCLEALARTLGLSTVGLTLEVIAGRLPAESATALRASGDALRSAHAALRAESGVVAHAARALDRHLGSLLDAVHAAAERRGTYGPQGRLASGPQLSFAVNVRS